MLLLLILCFFAYTSYTRPSPEDYCAHIAATLKDVRRCSLPFSVEQSVAGTCPEVKEGVELAYGICAHQGEAPGLYIATSM